MCDTFVVLPPNTANGSIIFGKNSDREPNEAQLPEYYPSAVHPNGCKLKCTYLEIPQVGETNAILISRPFWMWGAEIGANEHGVAIGNEAVWSKMPLEKSGRLTGMDLLRLALERSATAETALETITELLAEFGQGGECGYQTRGMFYHNSFIIADHREAWVLETAGNLWVAKKVSSFYVISNGLTIEEDYHLAHPDLIITARKKGWLRKNRVFNFAKNYSDWFYTTFSGSRDRRSCSTNFFQSKTTGFNVTDAFTLLRDHGTGNYTPDGHFLMNCVCAHSANKIARHSAQSTASLVAELSKDQQTYWATGTSAPCTGIFKPLRFGNTEWPDDGLGTEPGSTNTSRWWRHELLHRSILTDFNKRLAAIKSEQNKLEQHYSSLVDETKTADISKHTIDAFNTSDQLEANWQARINKLPVENRPRNYYRRYWKHQNRAAGIRLL